ncbi:thiosulfate:glutathione sulfurtransferase [Sardina pilchardus]|uniref:thiosulfate:glutathione sulfurtransferase n=1 Tax=Sardina pilchardus TaxID=27697 RepID=UPI002E1510EE
MAGAEISYSELKDLMEQCKELLLVDVRSKEEVDRGRIPGSIHIPVDQVENDMTLDAAAFQQKFGTPKPPLDSPSLIFHCQMGRRGATATQKARSLGFEKARNFVGGYKEWSAKEGK